MHYIVIVEVITFEGNPSLWALWHCIWFNLHEKPKKKLTTVSMMKQLLFSIKRIAMNEYVGPLFLITRKSSYVR